VAALPDSLRIAPPARLADALGRPQAAAAAPPERLAYRLGEVARLLGISKRRLQQALAAGEVPANDIRLGRIKLWSRDLLLRWIAGSSRT
jgi:hypothetical protein